MLSVFLSEEWQQMHLPHRTVNAFKTFLTMIEKKGEKRTFRGTLTRGFPHLKRASINRHTMRGATGPHIGLVDIPPSLCCLGNRGMWILYSCEPQFADL